MTTSSSNRPTQLPLGLSLDDDALLENFYTTVENQQLLSTLSKFSIFPSSANCPGHEPSQGNESRESESKVIGRVGSISLRYLYLWGREASGRSHLLQGLCHRLAQQEHPVFYLPLSAKADYSPEILEGLGPMSLVCVDDIDQIAGDKAWEEALFHCFNSLADQGATLAVSANSAPLNLHTQLADLKSRLQSGLTYEVQEMDDESRQLALIFRAKRRGIPLADNVANFICLRCHRSMTAMMQVLDQLDHAALSKQQKLTIPLVKEVTGW